MTGSKTTSMTLDELRTASAPGKGKTRKNSTQTTAPYVWDGQDEDDRPLTSEEMQAGIETYRRQRGRPSGSDKESTTCEKSVNIGKKPRCRLCFVLDTREKISNFLGMIWRLRWMTAAL